MEEEEEEEEECNNNTDIKETTNDLNSDGYIEQGLVIDNVLYTENSMEGVITWFKTLARAAGKK